MGRLKHIPGMLREVLKEGIEIPKLEDLVSHFFRACGGPKEVARMLSTEFKAAKPGSMIRQRILEMILRAARHADERTPEEGDMSLLSEDDLERRASELLRRRTVPAEGSDDHTTAEPQPAEHPEPAGDAGPAAAGEYSQAAPEAAPAEEVAADAKPGASPGTPASPDDSGAG